MLYRSSRRRSSYDEYGNIGRSESESSTATSALSPLDKLRKIWSKQPYEDIDCRLSESYTVKDYDLKSYCINVGASIFVHPENEKSDVTGLKKKKEKNW